MRLFETQHIFNYPWELVTCANWLKYPNDNARHVIGVDILRREVDENGTLRTERLITCQQSAPRWIKKLTGGDVSYVREVSEVNPGRHSLVMHSTNLTFSNYISVHETVSYVPDHRMPECNTLFRQEATIRASFKHDRGIALKVAKKLEDFSFDRFMQNAQLGRIGFESVLERECAPQHITF